MMPSASATGSCRVCGKLNRSWATSMPPAVIGAGLNLSTRDFGHSPLRISVNFP